MEESKDPKASNESESTPNHDAEATSSETLSDIEEGEKIPMGSGSGSSSSDLEGSSPKPDGGGDGGRADGSDTGGPM